jgi:hypothetical protein
VHVRDLGQRAVVREQVDQAVVGDGRDEEAGGLASVSFTASDEDSVRADVGEHAQPVACAPLLGQVVKDVDRERRPAVLAEHGRRAHERPAALAAVAEAVLHDALALAPLGQRDPARAAGRTTAARRPRRAARTGRGWRWPAW